MQLSFDFGVFKSEHGAIVPGNHILILQYNGTDNPEVVAENPALELNC